MDVFPDSYSRPASAEPENPLNKRHDIGYLKRLGNLLVSFSPAERLALYVLTGILAISALALLAGVNASTSVSVPASGGTLTEGVVGTARFINPLLALSEPDRDISQLVYSGLMRVSPDGSIVPDLASSYEISGDGTTYTFVLRQGLTFHDGTPFTAADVLFTVRSAQNADVKSLRRADWEGVTVASPDPFTVVFTLPRPYAPFLENTTLGILPAHLWQNVTPEEFPFSPLNTNPVGTGPFQVKAIDTDKTGALTRYELTPFQGFALGTPHLSKITFVFFPNEGAAIEAWNAGRIDSFAGISPSELPALEEPALILRAPLPRVFGVFLNQGHAPVLQDIAVRAALDAAIDKQALANAILRGYAAILDGPIPPSALSGGMSSEGALTVEPDPAFTEEARAILERNDWTWSEEDSAWKNEDDQALSFTLVTSDSPELVATAETLAKWWQAAGMLVSVHVYPTSELNSSIIRPRAYDALLFGEVVGRTLDLFAFWHSSQRNDPGLNLALYTNTRADSLLANARATTNRNEREDLYMQFAEVVKEDRPAVFLFAPQFLYVFPEHIQGVTLGTLATPSERFVNVHEWYTETEQVWSVFTNVAEE
ncbi:peptide ABC transporter substrate-binding protein [Candidatus Parcubacteria bacterium]|nr:MAG: peptide ABC transporter substrate-binding protein [Candidatus Parcubacteria bacterium]